MNKDTRVFTKKHEAEKNRLVFKTRNKDPHQIASRPIDDIFHLQKTIGNQAVQRMIRSGSIQEKLRIGQPGDIYEQEADRVADEVMRMPKPKVRHETEDEVNKREEEFTQTKALSNQITPLVQRQEEEGKKEEMVQPKPIADQITPFVQRQEEEEEEEIQTKSVNEQIRPFVQCQVEEEEEEETLQTKPLIEPLSSFAQRQIEEEEEEELILAKPLSEQFVPLVQNQEEEEKEEEEIQTKPISHQISPLAHRQLEENEEEMTQTKPLFQRQPEHEEEEEEEPVQTKFKKNAAPQPQLQRQQEEEERDIQAKSYQRKQANEETMPVLKKGRKGDSFAGKSVENRLTMASGGGSPLPGEIRTFMEPRFGLDFSHVRVHTENDAVQLNKQLNAQAFTHRRDIYFGDNKFKPRTYEGNRLIAHELTHVVQQGAALRPKLFQVTSAPHKIQRFPGPVANLLNKVAKNVPGYTLITVIIGKNPITGDPVPRTAKSLLGGFLGLVPGGTALFDKLNKAGAVDEAFSWLQKQIKVLNITWSGVKALVSEAWDRISIWYSLSENLKIIKDIFAPTFGRVIKFVRSLGKKVMEFIFKGALRLVGAPVKKIMAILNKGKAVISKIIINPVGFIKNLFNALVKGIRMFCGNIVKHLMSGIAGWLFGTLSKAGITLPEKFDLKGIFFLVAQILDVTWQSIRRRIVKALGPSGEKIMSAIEKTVDFIQDFIKRGPIAIWDRIKEFLGNLKDMIMSAVIDWVKSTIVFKAIEKLISFFNPAGAIIQAVIAIYNVIMFFVNRYHQIIAFAESVFNSIAEIASGNIAKAAKAVENAMARALPVMISFLARLIGLGGISAKIRKVIMKMRKPVDIAMNKVIGWVVKKGKVLLRMGQKFMKKGKEKIAAFLGWLKIRQRFKDGAGGSHELYFQGDQRDARLIVASKRQSPVDDFLRSIEKKSGDDKSKRESIESARMHHVEVERIVKDLYEVYRIENQGKQKKDAEKRRKNLQKSLRLETKKLVNCLEELFPVEEKEADLRKMHDLAVSSLGDEGRRLLVGHGESAQGRESRSFRKSEHAAVDEIGYESGDHSYSAIIWPVPPFWRIPKGQSKEDKDRPHWTPDHMPPISIKKGGACFPDNKFKFYPHSRKSSNRQGGIINSYIAKMKKLRRRTTKWAAEIKPEWFHDR